MTPRFVEIWDTSDDGYAYQIFIDYDDHTVQAVPYDKKDDPR